MQLNEINNKVDAKANTLRVIRVRETAPKGKEDLCYSVVGTKGQEAFCMIKLAESKN